MAGFKIYDASEVSVIFLGIPIDSGFGEGEFVRITKTKANFIVREGTDGELTRSKTNSKHHTIKITLMQSGDGNAKLSAISQLDQKAGNGAGVGPLLVKDRQGTSVFLASKAWIANDPEVVYAQQAEGREWMLECADAVRFDGGN